MQSFARLALLGMALLAPVRASPLLGPANGADPPTSIAPKPTAPFPPPSQDPFYIAPANLSAYAEGAVIRSRPVNTIISNDNLAGAFQVYYRTVATYDRKDEPAGNVATVFVPKKPNQDQTSILSYQFYEDSVSFNCAPSWALVANSNSPNTATAVLDTPIFVNYALSQGWYAVASDHEGRNSSFISGTTEGVNILNALRATIEYEHLPKDSQIGFYGYSGGGHATVWAANLAGVYAPELNIIGAVHGGTPIDPKGIFYFLNGGLFAGFAGAGVAGLMSAHPELNDYVEAHLTPRGKEIISRVRTEDVCLAQVVSGYPFENFLNDIDVQDPLDKPIPAKYLKIESLDEKVNPEGVHVPKFPTLQLHALLDEIVPFDAHAAFVDAQCKRGANIQFQVLPLAEHILGEVESVPGALLWLNQAFNGKLSPFVCGTPFPDFANTSSPEAQKILGPETVAQLRSLQGTQTPFGVIDFNKTTN